MKRIFKVSACLMLGLGTIAGFSGCKQFIGEEDEQEVPWSRPASWEGTVPGMPSTPG